MCVCVCVDGTLWSLGWLSCRAGGWLEPFHVIAKMVFFFKKALSLALKTIQLNQGVVQGVFFKKKTGGGEGSLNLPRASQFVGSTLGSKKSEIWGSNDGF